MSEQQTAIGSARTLAGGHTVTLRSQAEGDRCYLEDDFHSPEIINRLVNAHAVENRCQFVAVQDNAIVAYGAARQLPGWSSHVAEIVLIVNATWPRHGVGTAMAQTLCEAARSLGGVKVIVVLLAEQTAGRAIFERLGSRSRTPSAPTTAAAEQNWRPCARSLATRRTVYLARVCGDPITMALRCPLPECPSLRAYAPTQLDPPRQPCRPTRARPSMTGQTTNLTNPTSHQ